MLKLGIYKHYKGNEYEGQITFTEQFKKAATQICVTGPVDYTKDDLGLKDKEILEILTYVKNY